MYKGFFGLKERPFGKTPDPKFLYFAPQYEEAMARLQYAVEEREIAVLTGEIGSGKTTLSRALLDRVEDAEVVLIINPRLTPNQFLREIARKLDLTPPHYRTDLVDVISDRIFSLYEEGKALVLMVDEAQLIPYKTTFDEIRLLSNFQLDDANLISIILIGQPELRRRFKHPAFQALRQRVGMWCHLRNLDAEESREYIVSRLRTAGGDGRVFTDDALDELYRLSEGVPRVLNNLCTNALLTGFGKEENPIRKDTVREAVAEVIL